MTSSGSSTSKLGKYGTLPFADEAIITSKTLASPMPLTIEDAVEIGGVGWFHYRLIGIVGFMFGSEAIEIFLWAFIKNKVQKYSFHVSDNMIALGPTFTFLGMIIGCLSIGSLADKKGRKLASFLSILLPAIGVGLMAIAPSFGFLLFANMFAGIGVGGAFILPALMLELLPKQNREFWVCLVYSIWTFGVLILCGEAYLLHEYSWRWLCALTVVPFILALMAFPFVLPESPRFLVTQGRPEEALKILVDLVTVNGHTEEKVKLQSPTLSSAQKNANEEGVQQNSGAQEEEEGKARQLIALLHGNVELVDAHGVPFRQHFAASFVEHHHDLATVDEGALMTNTSRKGAASCCEEFCGAIGNTWAGIKTTLQTLFSPKLRRLTGILWVIWGATSMCYYGIAMLTTNAFLGKNANSDSYLTVAICSSGEFPTYFIMYFAAKYWGRKGPLFLAPILAAIFLGLVKAFQQPKDDRSFDNAWYDVDVLCAFLSRCFTLTQFDLVYLLSPESYPTTVRGAGTGAASAIARVTSLGTSYIAYSLIDVNPYLPYAIYGAALLISGFAALFLPFDTKDKALSDDVDSVQGDDETPEDKPNETDPLEGREEAQAAEIQK